MQASSESISLLCTITAIFFRLLFLEILNLIRTLTRSTTIPEQQVITTTLYLKLVEKENPTIRCTKRNILCLGLTGCSVCLSECLEDEIVRKFKCEHSFHRDCLDTWLLLQHYQATCPLCRTKFLPDEIVEHYRLLRNKIELDGIDEKTVFLLSALRGDSLLQFF